MEKATRCEMETRSCYIWNFDHENGGKRVPDEVLAASPDPDHSQDWYKWEGNLTIAEQDFDYYDLPYYDSGTRAVAWRAKAETIRQLWDIDAEERRARYRLR